MSEAVAALIEHEGLPAGYREIVERYWQPLADEIVRRAAERSPLIVGINGAQGAGKSTLCRFLEVLLERRGSHAVTLSIDDLYLTKAERERLAREVHPLLATRGVPGTHCPALGLAIIEAVRAGHSFDMPRFDKSIDDRSPQVEPVAGPVDVLLFEGWCLGAGPQEQYALATPVNALEAEEDPAGTWRQFVNDALRNDYAALFEELDMLVMLKVPDFQAVRRNRALQEEKLRARSPEAPGLMDATALKHFLDQDERLTEHMFAEMPPRADVLVEIGRDQRPVRLSTAAHS